MGWASGSYLAQELWEEVRELIPLDKRREVAMKFFTMFSNEDADDWSFACNLFTDAGFSWNQKTEEYLDEFGKSPYDY